MRTCRDCKVAVASQPRKSARKGPPNPPPSVRASPQVVTTNPRTCEPSFSTLLREGGLVGTCLDGCRMQQAVPQHFPSWVPQQQVVREGFDSAALLDPWDCVHTGATLVPMASKATAIARMGCGGRYILGIYGKRCSTVQQILQPPAFAGNKGFLAGVLKRCPR
jgi:hypothetical protein